MGFNIPERQGSLEKVGRDFHKDKVLKSRKGFLRRPQSRWGAEMGERTPRDGVTRTTIPKITPFSWHCPQGLWRSCKVSCPGRLCYAGSKKRALTTSPHPTTQSEVAWRDSAPRRRPGGALPNEGRPTPLPKMPMDRSLQELAQAASGGYHPRE